MALLPYVDESKISDKTREILGNTPRKLNVARMIANASDAVFQNFSRLGNSLMTRGKLDQKLREIAILRNARVCNSMYEYTQHVPIAKAAGLSGEQIAGIDRWESAQCFNEIERLVDFDNPVWPFLILTFGPPVSRCEFYGLNAIHAAKIL